MARGFSFVFALLIAIFSSAFLPTRAAAEPRVYLTSNMKVMVDGKEIHCNWWQGHCDFGSLFDDTIEAKADFAEYEKISMWPQYFRLAAVAGFVGYSIVVLGTDHNWDGGSALAFLLVPWLTGDIISFHAHKHLIRAINIMNGVAPDQAILTPTRSSIHSSEFAMGAPIFRFDF